MRRRVKVTSGAALLSALALAGCSNSSAPAGITIPFKSPAIVNTLLPATYTCDGKDIAPPVEWGAVPSTTRELALFVLGLTPHGSKGGYSTTVEWSVAGINPALHALSAGKLPVDAHVGLTSKGKRQPYSICPAKGTSKRYQFALYAVPTSITIPARFVGIKLLEALADPESRVSADAGGTFLASYRRT